MRGLKLSVVTLKLTSISDLRCRMNFIWESGLLDRQSWHGVLDLDFGGRIPQNVHRGRSMLGKERYVEGSWGQGSSGTESRGICALGAGVCSLCRDKPILLNDWSPSSRSEAGAVLERRIWPGCGVSLRAGKAARMTSKVSEIPRRRVCGRRGIGLGSSGDSVVGFLDLDMSAVSNSGLWKAWWIANTC